MRFSRRDFLRISAGAAGALLVGGCINTPTDLPAYTPPLARALVPSITDEVRLPAFGDWGVHNWNQWGVVQGLDAASKELGGFHAGLLLGDNFYSSGVNSVEDALFNENFAKLYDTEQLGNLTWHAILGNHDYKGNVEAQIQYTERSSGRWYMPAHYYRRDFAGTAGPLLTVLAIDTDPGFGGWREQLAWLEQQLISLQGVPQAVVVIGHHTIISYSTHGATDHVVEFVDPLLRRYRVAAYLCGHDHCMQVNENGGVTYAVLGGGGADAYGCSTGPASKFAVSAYGFGVVRASRGALTLEVRDNGGKVLYTQTRRV